MKEDIVSLELAIKLKEMGFDELCYNFWSLEPDGKPLIITSTLGNIRSSDLKGRDVTAPFLWQAQKWLREVKGIDIEIIAHQHLDGESIKHQYNFGVLTINGETFANTWYNNYEKALSDAIDTALELLTNKS